MVQTLQHINKVQRLQHINMFSQNIFRLRCYIFFLFFFYGEERLLYLLLGYIELVLIRKSIYKIFGDQLYEGLTTPNFVTLIKSAAALKECCSSLEWRTLDPKPEGVFLQHRCFPQLLRASLTCDPHPPSRSFPATRIENPIARNSIQERQIRFCS